MSRKRVKNEKQKWEWMDGWTDAMMGRCQLSEETEREKRKDFVGIKDVKN